MLRTFGITLILGEVLYTLTPKDKVINEELAITRTTIASENMIGTISHDVNIT